MTTAMPTRTHTQRIDALTRANTIRTSRANMKRLLHHDGLEGAAAATIGYITAPPWWLETMLVRDLLLAIPRIGPSRVDRLLTATQTNPRKTVAGISTRQRAALTMWLRVLAAPTTPNADTPA